MKEQEKIDFLIQELCDDENEKEELKQWIEKAGVDQVYQRIHELFYEEDDE